MEDAPGSSTPGNEVFQFKASISWVDKFCVRHKISPIKVVKKKVVKKPAAKKASVVVQGAAAELDLDSIRQQLYNLPCTPDGPCGCQIDYELPDFVEAFFINHPDGQNVITFDPDTEGWFIH